jgi:bifunctional non-homologous end joining protein LigD
MTDALKTYRAKRNFAVTPEPAEGGEGGAGALSFVIQKHWASRLHYDFRLELDGTMKSWAVPKGPSYDSHDKRMAVQVEDHPISYSSFEGTIPEKQYGAGKVIIWDKGTWTPLQDDARAAYAAGNLKFELHGHKMHGKWVLVRMKGRGEKQQPWLLIKEKDDYVRPADEFSVVDEHPDSVKALPMPRGATTTSTNAAAGAPAAAPAVKTKAAPKKAAAAKLVKPAAAPAPDGKPPRAALPEAFSPQLATLVDAPPGDASDWLFELKFDGYRLLARIDGKDIRLLTRNGHDWTVRLPALKAALAKMKLPPGWYDGEIVVHDAQGRPDFGALQLAFDASSTSEIVYFLFDLPYFDGYDLRAAPLESRRALLQAALERSPAAQSSDTVRFSATIEAPAADIMTAACKLGLEGVIGKRRDAAYVSRRSDHWIKLKCGQRQEFVIGGYTDPQGARKGLGSLLLGVHDDDGALRYVGNVGSGFNQDSLRTLTAKLEKLAASETPFAKAASKSAPAPARGAHWVKPQLLAEVSFAAWTNGGAIRHAVYQGLREDKPAARITRDRPGHVKESAMQDEETEGRQPASRQPAKKAVTKKAVTKNAAARNGKNEEAAEDAGEGGTLPANFKISHGDRVIDQASGATKLQLVRYYALVAKLMLAHLKGRPVSLVRAPAGVGGELFFQKHAEASAMAGIKQLDQALDPGHAPMLEVATKQGLLSAAQWNVVELHTQNAYASDYERPNRMVFDLDPGEGVAWKAVREAAQLMRAFLEELGLRPFVKTSGGKGLHVVVPLKPEFDWDTVKAFSKAVVAHMAQTIPQRFVQKSGGSNRVGKIFIDYLRNGRGSTTACAWSARSRPGLGISVPVAWEELDALKGGDHWTVATAHTRLDQGNAPWAAYAKSARALGPAMKRLGFTPGE